MKKNGFTLVPMVLILVFLGITTAGIVKYKAKTYDITAQNNYNNVSNFIHEAIRAYTYTYKELPAAVRVGPNNYAMVTDNMNIGELPAPLTIKKVKVGGKDYNVVDGMNYIPNPSYAGNEFCTNSTNKLVISSCNPSLGYTIAGCKGNSGNTDKTGRYAYGLIFPGSNGVYNTIISEGNGNFISVYLYNNRTGTYTLNNVNYEYDDIDEWVAADAARFAAGCADNINDDGPRFIIPELPPITEKMKYDVPPNFPDQARTWISLPVYLPEDVSVVTCCFAGEHWFFDMRSSGSSGFPGFYTSTCVKAVNPQSCQSSKYIDRNADGLYEPQFGMAKKIFDEDMTNVNNQLMLNKPKKIQLVISYNQGGVQKAVLAEYTLIASKE